MDEQVISVLRVANAADAVLFLIVGLPGAGKTMRAGILRSHFRLQSPEGPRLDMVLLVIDGVPGPGI